jgi:hypothetical protein
MFTGVSICQPLEYIFKKVQENKQILNLTINATWLVNDQLSIAFETAHLLFYSFRTWYKIEFIFVVLENRVEHYKLKTQLNRLSWCIHLKPFVIIQLLSTISSNLTIALLKFLLPEDFSA